MYVKKNMVGMLLPVVVKMEKISLVLLMIQQLRLMELLKKKQKQLQHILIQKIQSAKQKISTF